MAGPLKPRGHATDRLRAEHDPRHWLDDRRGYVPLSEFPPLLLALRDAGDPGWARRHPAEPSIEERARAIAERRTGMPAYLVDDEVWDAAMAEASACGSRP